MRLRAILLGGTCSLMAVGALAQSETDVLRFSQTYMKGSARFTAMGGAFGALGGDMSSFMINPAGVGVYRSSEFTFSTGILNSNQKIDYRGDRSFDGHTSVNVGNAGLVLNFFNNSNSELRNFNLGISYNRLNDFNQNTFLSGVNNENSITDYFAEKSYGIKQVDLLSQNPFDSNLPWNSILAWKTYLMDPASSDNNNQFYLTPLARTRYAKDPYYAPYARDIDKKGLNDAVFQDQWEEVRGFNDVVNIAFGGNLMDVVYVGGSLNITNINYHSTKNYHEQADKNNLSNFNELNYEEIYNAYGTGVSLGLGMILKPIQEIRIGVSYQSPTWNSIDEDYSAYMNSTFLNVNNGFAEYDTPINTFSYRISSPQRLTGSLGFILGNYGIISADVDWVNYAGMRIHGSNDYRTLFNNINSAIDNSYRNTINARVGGELKLDKLAFRAGYQYYQNPYKKDFINSDNATNVYSAGFGYRTRSFFFDFAYSLMTMKNAYSLYDYYYKDANSTVDIYSGTATSNINRNSYIVTLGFKF
ncbi:outer membrane protein transport protein [uncultured Acetobacteroides sp.]|uniref:OmpP1/FadL family transporter n=1 Tax=uncultured Acetobacteroides sp. TaxID=1760811 RepID=UPI0029F55840|nr:outer membrane protein transport protein [uncultured Acetobacteroides sp.]